MRHRTPGDNSLPRSARGLKPEGRMSHKCWKGSSAIPSFGCYAKRSTKLVRHVLSQCHEGANSCIPLNATKRQFGDN